MKGNNEDSSIYSGPISSASRTKIYVNFAHQTHNLCAIKNIIQACQKLQFVNKYTIRNILKKFWMNILVCLNDLILYVPVNTFSVMSGWFFMGWTSSKQVLMCLGQTHNADGGIPESSLVLSQALYDKATVHPPWNSFGRSSPSVDLKRLAVSNWQNINNYVHVARKCLQSAWIVTVWIVTVW